MNAAALIRRTHRGIALVFTATVIANFAAMALGAVPLWLVYLPLAPLGLLLLSGIWLFAEPRLLRRSGG